MSTLPVLLDPCWPACMYSPGNTLLHKVPVYMPALMAEEKFATVWGTSLPYSPVIANTRYFLQRLSALATAVNLWQ